MEYPVTHDASASAPNYLPMTSTTDWKTYTERMIELCTRLGVRHYIKKDLADFLPADYSNPMRVEQYHAQ